MTIIDEGTELGQRILKELRDELVVWLTTTSADSTPQPNPVWFITDGDDIIVYSHKSAARNHNIQRNPRVSLNFNTDPAGDHMSVMTGSVVVDESIPKANDNPAYLEKYGDRIPGLGMTFEQYGETYSVPIRITPTKIRGW